MKIAQIQAMRLDAPPEARKSSVTPPRRPSWAAEAEVANPMSRYPQVKPHRSLWMPRWGEVWCKVTAEDGTWGAGSTGYGRPVAAVIDDHLARQLVGEECLATENLFVDIAYGTAQFRELLEIVHEYNLEDIQAWCRTAVDGIVFSDDWGSNRSLLIRPSVWRELFKPLYREYVELIHAADKFAFFHSDGHIAAIFGDLVELGIDAINSQLFTMDIEELGRHYRGKVTFWGEMDRQHILPFGTPDEVCAAVSRVRAALGDVRGGLIAQCEWGKHDPGTNIDALYQAWLMP